MLDDFVLAEPLARQELVFHEAALAFAALLTELETLGLDAAVKRSIVAEITPGIVDAWIGTRMAAQHGVPGVPTVTVDLHTRTGAPRRLSLRFLAHALALWRFVRADNARNR